MLILLMCCTPFLINSMFVFAAIFVAIKRCIKFLILKLFKLDVLFLYQQVLQNDIDLLNPPAELEKRKHKLKRLVQSPNSFFMVFFCFYFNCMSFVMINLSNLARLSTVLSSSFLGSAVNVSAFVLIYIIFWVSDKSIL